MTRKGQPKVRTGCLTCKSRKVKCDEAKPACVRCTSTGRKCDGYAVVVPSNRALARARSRTTRLNAALAHVSAAWDGDMDEEKVMEHFRREVAPMMPGHLEGQFWTDIMPRMGRTEPAFRQAMAAIATLMPGCSDDALEDGNTGYAIDPYTRVMSVLEGNTRKQKEGVDSQPVGDLTKRSSHHLGHPNVINSPASSSPASLSSTSRLSITPNPEINPSGSCSGLTNPVASPQQHEYDSDSDPRVHNEVNITLSGCLLFITVEFLRHGLQAAMEQLASGIDVLNNVDYKELATSTVINVLPQFHRLSIIQLCFYDRPGFPSLDLTHGGAPRYNLGPFNKDSSIYRPQSAMDAIILDAIRYIRTAGPESRTDSRLASKGPVMDEQQTAICNAFDKWHAAFTVFIREPRHGTDQPLPSHTGIVCAETEMKYLTAKICVSICRSHDESVYDCFKDSFRRITALAQEIYQSCLEIPAESAEYRFNFKMSYLPLLEFVVTKCRWLDIRYQAWMIVWGLATARNEPITLRNLHLVGKRTIEREHNAKIEEINRENAHLFSLPAEEMRIKDYTTDHRFADLAVADETGGSKRIQVPYNQRLLLQCGSYELDELARWVAKDVASAP
ncbi:C6 finger domain-containing protein [Colletotrichum truncatum]|uniref:C6 finger domain-containing protein n=1 Tax=Colletotrichum truncatum TaxID=5467 RepID=A0ACC3YH62_COLTU|nr:C6 finger domain-containing protein [Colletotrichum truncatum]KAF6792751.1 C6 finger domain-containing protein [Colletotrichum truncatum]